VIETESAEFTIRLTRPNVQVEWFKDGQPVDLTTDKFKVESLDKEYKLIINDCQMNDTSKISCKLPSGEESKAKLFVEGN
jgi:hypothetical protein